MKIACQFMELGKSLFLLGTNYGEKITPKSSKGNLKIFWDTEEKRAEIHSDKGHTFVTESWVFTYEPIQDKPAAPVNVHHDQRIVPAHAQVGGPQDVFKTQPFTAQVSTPISQPPKKPGRPAKFQGEESQGE